MNEASGRSRGASSSTISDRQTAAACQLGSETIGDSQQPDALLPSSRIVAYRGVRGLKHRNDRLQRSAATTAVLGRPPGTAVSERQNVADRCPSSSNQPRPVRSTSSRRSVSADRQAASTSSPRTLFETLYQEKVMSRLPPSTSSDDSVGRCARLAVQPPFRWRCVNATPSSVGLEAAAATDRRRSPTSLELDACCRRNIVSDRTRFFEEKSRRPAAEAAAPLRRRSRSAAARLSRADDRPPSNRSHEATTRTTHSAATHAVPSTTVHHPPVPASSSVFESILPVNNIGVNNETDQLKA